MTPTDLDVSVAQLDPELGDVAQNYAAVETTIRQAKQAGSDLVVFPELFLTGYHIGPESRKLTEEATDAVADLRSLTDDIVVVLGTPMFGDSNIHNSAVVLSDGNVKGAYHKTHLYGSESETFEPGAELPTFETPVGALGVEICYDVEFPEVARRLVTNGADILITISANMRPCVRDQELYHGTRAIENGVPHVLCNRVGEERGVDFFGKSGIVDFRGRAMLSLGADISVMATGPIRDSATRGKTHDYLGDRRPELYTD